MDFRVGIRRMQPGDVDRIFIGLADYDVSKPRGYVEHCWQENLTGQRVTFLALHRDDCAGWGHLVRESEYAFFREQGIPEIQNFDVIPPFRRHDVGSQLMDAIEQWAFGQYDVIGIGFGLYADYGTAQRRYVKRDYIPDGRGVMSHNHPVVQGATFWSMTIWYCSSPKANPIILNRMNGLLSGTNAPQRGGA